MSRGANDFPGSIRVIASAPPAPQRAALHFPFGGSGSRGVAPSRAAHLPTMRCTTRASTSATSYELPLHFESDRRAALDGMGGRCSAPARGWSARARSAHAVCAWVASHRWAKERHQDLATLTLPTQIWQESNGSGLRRSQHRRRLCGCGRERARARNLIEECGRSREWQLAPTSGAILGTARFRERVARATRHRAQGSWARGLAARRPLAERGPRRGLRAAAELLS